MSRSILRPTMLSRQPGFMILICDMVVSLLSSTRPPSLLWLVATKKIPGIKICDQLGSFKSHIVDIVWWSRNLDPQSPALFIPTCPRNFNTNVDLKLGADGFSNERDVASLRICVARHETWEFLLDFFVVWKTVDSLFILSDHGVYIYIYTCTYLGSYFGELFVSPLSLHIFSEILKAKFRIDCSNYSAVRLIRKSFLRGGFHQEALQDTYPRVHDERVGSVPQWCWRIKIDTFVKRFFEIHINAEKAGDPRNFI